ncbi:MAG: hypothetical protein HZA17_13360 [Nitrospirae bacterium]|nr:hypothetical protein [Nitrospirota bacterium]
MKSYIIRICRHEQDNTGLLVGVVEDPEGEKKKRFSSMEELWKILNSNTKRKRDSVNNTERESIQRKGGQFNEEEG